MPCSTAYGGHRRPVQRPPPRPRPSLPAAHVLRMALDPPYRNRVARPPAVGLDRWRDRRAARAVCRNLLIAPRALRGGRLLAHMMLRVTRRARCAPRTERALPTARLRSTHRPPDVRMTARDRRRGVPGSRAVVRPDVRRQVLHGATRRRPLESISAYYRRVTTDARPMNLLVGAVMAALAAAIVVQIARDDAPAWVGWASLALAARRSRSQRCTPFPRGAPRASDATRRRHRSALARSIRRDHLLCLAAIAALIAIQLAAGGIGWRRWPPLPLTRRRPS